MARQSFKRRKFCRFTAEKIQEVDYKQVDLLKDFIPKTEKSFLPALPEPKPITNVSWLPPLNARVSWLCCRIPINTNNFGA